MKGNKLAAWGKTITAGSWVVVRSKEEIAATLDADACLDALPFQPEMLEFCGQRMRVAKVAHKTCDNIEKTGGRWMREAYHLEGARCDGGGHDGCQADCVFFWKLDWLKPDNEFGADGDPITDKASSVDFIHQRAKAAGEEGSDDPIWICQTTKLYDATDFLPWWDLRQYVKDVTSGNHSVWHMVKLLTAATYRNLVSLGFAYGILIKVYNTFQRVFGGKSFPDIEGEVAKGDPTPTELTDLEAGDWVEVKPREEIAKTLTLNGFNRGMRYDREMLKYSGEQYRVQMRVDRLINEVTGKMMVMKNPCIQLEDVYCRAECTPMRLGCPRASNTYWREIWLRQIADPESDPTSTVDSK